MQAADLVSREHWRTTAVATLWMVSSPEQREVIARGGPALFVRRASAIYGDHGFHRSDFAWMFDAFKARWAKELLTQTIVDAHGKLS